MAAEGDNITRYIYRGEEGEVIPRGRKIIVIVDDSVTVVLRRAFQYHPTIIDVICHDKVGTIEEKAFNGCISLRRIIMRGVTVVERRAFDHCPALTHVVCDKLEIIKEYAFVDCDSLRSIYLPSVRTVEEGVFRCCTYLTDVKFGTKLERIEGHAFGNCSPLERITIPLKDGMITNDNIFQGCNNLNHEDLVEGVQLQKTIAALQLEDWRNDMNQEIDAINQILPSTDSGDGWEIDDGDIFHLEAGENALAIQTWIRSALRKIVHYKAEHRRMLDEAATALHCALPRDIIVNNVLSFLALPLHTFDGEDQEMNEHDNDEE